MRWRAWVGVNGLGLMVGEMVEVGAGGMKVLPAFFLLCIMGLENKEGREHGCFQ